MSGRPKPNIVATAPRKNYRQIEICEAPETYLVVMKGKPFKIRINHQLLDGQIKYPRVSFSHVGHAQRMADRLNDLFQTEEFGVKRLEWE